MRSDGPIASRWFWRIVTPTLAVVVGGCGSGLWRAAQAPKNGISVERLEAELRDALPLGSDRNRARDWFASHGIQFRGEIWTAKVK
jgi:hypothetical protein